MKNTDHWTNLTAGKFWASGAQVWRPGENKYMPRSIVDHDGKKSISYFSTWDLTRIGNQNYGYFSDDYLESYFNKHDSLKPCLLNCMQSFLEPDTQEFVTDLYSQATSAMQTHCEPEFWHAFAFLTTPGYSVGYHRHDIPKPWSPLSFTYVVASQHSAVKTDYLTSTLENGRLQHQSAIVFPNVEKSFMIHDSTMLHGAQSHSDDKNTYLYFIFDGVTPKSHIALNQFYEFTQ